MKKHKIELSYKDLHAIKHGLQYMLHFKNNVDIETERNEQFYKDIEHESNLLERITEKINYIKDLYKI